MGHRTVYTHRQRVLTAFSHRMPDRPPLDMMGNASMLLDGTYLRLRDYLGLSPIPPIRSGYSANYYDERILDYFDIDFRRIFALPGASSRKTHHPDGSFTDEWGVRFKQVGLFVNTIEHPLAGVDDPKSIDTFAWPKADDLISADGLAIQAKRMFTETDFALVARNPLSYGFLDRGCMLMGMENFLTAMITAPEIAQRVIYHLVRIYCEVYSIFLDAVGPYVQMVEVADDLGTQQGLLISPTLYRKFIKPAEQELYTLIHQKAPDAALFRHSDGAIFDLIADLIEVGVDVLNPIQTSARGMDADRLKATYGDRITFHGGIEHIEGDVPVEVVVAEVKDRIKRLGANGGYVVASCNHMIDVRPEVIVAMFETARAYGE